MKVGSSTSNKPKLNFFFVYTLFLVSENIMSSSKDVNGNFTIPEWVKQDIFLDILKKDVEGFVAIKSFKVEPGSSVGENYMSIILRVCIGVQLEGKWLCLLFSLVIWSLHLAIVHWAFFYINCWRLFFFLWHYFDYLIYLVLFF